MPLDLADEFQAVLDRAEGTHGGGDGFAVYAGARGGERGGQNVFDIVAAADGDLAGRHERLAVED